MPGQSVQIWGARVRVVESTQDSRGRDLRGASDGHRLKSGLDRARHVLPEPLMRPKVIVEVHVFLHRPVHVMLIQNEHVIEALALQTSDESLTNSIGLGCLDRYFQFLDACAAGDGRE